MTIKRNLLAIGLIGAMAVLIGLSLRLRVRAGAGDAGVTDVESATEGSPRQRPELESGPADTAGARVGPPIVAGEFVVRVADGTSEDELRALYDRYGLVELRRFGALRRVSAPDGDPAAVIARLGDEPRLTQVGPVPDDLATGRPPRPPAGYRTEQPTDSEQGGVR